MTNLKLAAPSQVAAWSKVAPGRIKVDLDAGVAAPPSRRPDVWVLDDRFGDRGVKVLPGDRLVVHSSGDEQDATVSGVLRGLGPASAGGFVWEVEPGSSGTEIRIRVGTSARSDAQVKVEVGAAPSGIDPRGQQ